jgi:hypothetical protein
MKNIRSTRGRSGEGHSFINSSLPNTNNGNQVTVEWYPHKADKIAANLELTLNKKYLS